MLQCFYGTGISQIIVNPVSNKDIKNYVIVDCIGYQLNLGERVEMVSVIEKQTKEKSHSNLAIVGRYILLAHIWPLLAKASSNSGGEIQLTNSIKMLMKSKTVRSLLP